MANTNYVKFLRGLEANYRALGTYDNNTLYITTDNGSIYLGDKRLGDYITVASIDQLPAAESAHVSALYYAEAENVLARSTGSKWVQINAVGLTSVKYNGTDQVTTGHDYITGVRISTNAKGERYLDFTTGKIEDHAVISQMAQDIADLQTDIGTLTGSGAAGSISDMISAAVSPVSAAAAKAQEDATAAINKNTEQDEAIQDLEGRVGNNETAISDEKTARETAITNLVNGASDGYKTLKDLEDKVKAADTKAQGAVDVNAEQAQTLTDHETRLGNAESAIGDEVEARKAAIEALVGAAADYKTLEALETAVKAAQSTADGAVTVNGTQEETLEDHESRLGAVETTVGVLNGTGEGSVKKQVADAVAGIVADADADFDTLKEVADWILNDKTGAAALQSDVAKLKNDVNGENGLSDRMDDAEVAIGDNADAIAQEVTDRQTAITNLVNGASNGYATLKDLEGKVKDAQGKADTNADDISGLDERLGDAEALIGEHTTAIGDNTDAIAQEKTDRETAITNLINGETTYNTFKAVGDAIVGINGDYSDLEGRVGDNETAIGNHATTLGEHTTAIGENKTAIEQEVTDRQTAITNLINGETDYATFKAAGDEIRAQDGRLGDVESALTWGQF